MQYPYLKYFITVAEFMSISRAAQHIHISQQGLSSYLRRLESYYQAELFVRKPRFALTPEGKLLLEKAKLIDQTFDQLDEIFHVNHSETPAISIGVVSSAFRYFTEKQLLVKYHAKFPDILVRLEDIPPAEIIEGLLDHQLDLGCTNVFEEHNTLQFDHLFSQRFVLVISGSTLHSKFGSSYPQCLDDFQQGVDLRDFQDISYFGYPTSYVITKLLRSYCEQEGISLTTRLENPTAEATMQMVMFGQGFTLLVEDRLPLFQKEAAALGQQFHSFPIKTPNLEIPYYLVSIAGKSYSPHIRSLIEMTRGLLC